MEELYPPGPSAVPPDLTRPTRAYRRHAWLACGGLLGFLSLYGFLCFWFTRTAYRCLAGIGAGSDKAVVRFLVGGVAIILSVFLLRALFGVARSSKPEAIEITREDEPGLFEFLNRLADDTGAPRPHRVFLSPLVNAAVFYDLSILNLLFPSKKNLEIGLGLVNALQLSELKAVLAHEMGHFAQRSMAVGRWVYVAQQIAANIVARRDWFDRALDSLSSTDIRIAWLGWLSRLIVWSLRALLDTAFQLLILAERALSREMEFQADLVAVSVTGSDALVHALQRAGSADEAWDRAQHVAAQELSRGRRVPDLFALQTRVTEHLRTLLQGRSAEPPPLPPEGRAAHRVFQEQLAQPPRMWATHPSNREREDNSKRVYVAADLDERSAWVLFRDPAQLRRHVSRALLDALARDPSASELSLDAALAAVDQRFQSPIFDRRYRGLYLGRPAALRAARVADLYGPTPAAPVTAAELDALYPPALGQQLTEWRNLAAEVACLKALRDGILDAPGGVLRHRGRPVERKRLEHVMADVEGERDRARAALDEHHRRCRTLHRAAAATLGSGWSEYLQQLAGLWHYAAHAEADVDDARGHLENVLSVVTADGRVTAKERERLVAAAVEMQQALDEVYRQRDEVVLPASVAGKLGVARWDEALPAEFTLPRPFAHDVGTWLGAFGGWHAAFSGALGALERCALECLLEAEAQVERAVRGGQHAGAAPAAARAPLSYRTRLEGSERARQRRLHWWDRFLTADGVIPGLGRLAVAGGILACVLGFGGAAQNATLVIHNGLQASVDVRAGEARATLSPGATRTLEVSPVEQLELEARSRGALIESFHADVSALDGVFVYNVAGASVLLEWTALYGDAREQPQRPIGAPRWSTSRADVLFAEPPAKLSSRSGNGTRTVLTALDGLLPATLLGRVEDGAERAQLAASHAGWDDARSAQILEWLALASEHSPDFGALVSDRLRRDPRDIPALRSELDAAPASERARVCARQGELARLAPSDPALQYVTIRCIAGARERNDRFIAAYASAPPSPWIANAAGMVFAERGEWQAAASALALATRLPALEESARLTLARILRLEPRAGTLPARAEESGALAWLRGMEMGTDAPDGPYRAYTWLARGELERALTQARPDPEVLVRVLRLAAASDGSSRAIVERSLSLPPEKGLDPQTLWASVSLAAREQRPLDVYREYVERSAGEHAPLMWALIGQAGANGEPGAFERRLVDLPLELQAQAYVMGAVLRGASAPREWRRKASALLFSPERPHFN